MGCGGGLASKLTWSEGFSLWGYGGTLKKMKRCFPWLISDSNQMRPAEMAGGDLTWVTFCASNSCMQLKIFVERETTITATAAGRGSGWRWLWLAVVYPPPPR